MKKTLTLLFVLFSVNLLFAQKEKEKKFDLDKKTMQYTDATGVLFLLEKSKSTSSPGVNNYYFNNTEGKHLIFVIYKRVTRARYISKNNVTGEVPYYEVNFVGLDDQKCEIRYYGTVENLGELFYEKKVIVNGELDVQAVKSFVMESGNNFTAY